VGDLDQAIQIYKQVVTDAQTAKKAAAQAQYRLGQCLLKQKKTDEAIAAFRQVIEDYPDQAEWVAKARKHVPEKPQLQLGPVPWEDGEFQQLTVKLGGGLKIGSFVWSVESARLDGQDVWRMKTYRYVLAGGDNRGMSLVDADKQKFQPIRSSFRHTLIGTTDAAYDFDAGKVTVTRPGTEDAPRSDQLERTYYDNEQGVFVFRRLPLAEGFQAKVPIYASFGAGKIDIEVKVVAKETIEVPAGSFECYKVHLLPVNQTFWHTADAHRYLVKFEAAGVTAELERLGQNKPDEVRPLRDDRFGFSLDLPASWYHMKESTSKDRPVRMVHLIDPGATAIHIVGVWKTDSIKNDEAKKSARAWAEHRLSSAKKELKELQIRPDSWEQRKVSGWPATSVIGDYLVGEDKKVGYSVFLLGEETACELTILACNPDQLDRKRAAFDKIIETFETK
jgi:hypothetical protein